MWRPFVYMCNSTYHPACRWRGEYSEHTNLENKGCRVDGKYQCLQCAAEVDDIKGHIQVSDLDKTNAD
jgi:hypothetical protein